MTSRTAPYPTDALFRGLKALLTSLPSEEEKRELLRTLGEAQSFLEEVRLLVETVPTMESSRELSEGLSRLDILVDRAQRDAGLGRLLGLRGSKTSSTKKTSSAQHAEARARTLEQRLSEVSDSDVASTLEQSREPLAVLTELAALLGMRTRSKERKPELIRRIENHVVNQRGYRILRGEDPDPAAVPRPRPPAGPRRVLAGRIRENG